jgi:hypothetical protein
MGSDPREKLFPLYLSNLPTDGLEGFDHSLYGVIAHHPVG